MPLSHHRTSTQTFAFARAAQAFCAAFSFSLAALLAATMPAQAQNTQRKWLETTSNVGAGKRIALVIGNTHYKGVGELRNPENDARAMAKSLQDLGFEVLLCLDQTNRQMADDIEEFGLKIEGADVALFYYSGHGAQVADQNYLLPVSFQGHSENSVKYDCLNVERVLDKLSEAKSRANIVILDACRDNPFAEAKPTSRGLAAVSAPDRTFVAYATAPGQTAADNPDGANGLFTQELLRQMEAPGVEVEDVFKNTRTAVVEASRGKQVPFETSSLQGVVMFRPGSGGGNVANGGGFHRPPISAQGRILLATYKHANDVWAAVFSPDNHYIVTGSKDTSAKVWDADSGQEITTFNGHSDTVTCAAFSPDGKYVVTGSIDHTAKMWDPMTGQEVRTLQGHSDGVLAVAYSPDGKYIVTASRDKTARVWDASTGKTVFTLTGHGGWVFDAAFSPDFNYIATASDDNTVKIWEAKTGSEVRTLKGHKSAVVSATFSPDSQFLVTGSKDKSAKIWEVSTWKNVRTLNGHDASVTAVSFSPNGRYILTGSEDKTVKIWNFVAGTQVRTLTGHTDIITAAAYAPNGRYIVTGSKDDTAKTWDATTGETAAN